MHLCLIYLLFLALWAQSGVYRVYGKRDLFGKKKKKKTSGWTMLWQDEFDYFDENKWEYQYQDGCHYGVCLWGNNEKSWYMKENVWVAKGKLNIQAREETGDSILRVQQGCWDYCGHLCSGKGLFGDSLSGCVKDCGAHRCPNARFTSGRIRTFGRFSISPSDRYRTIRIEAKIKLNSGAGLWPAFWMLPEEGSRADCSGCGMYGNWPASGEIDIMETFGSMAGVNGTIHFGGEGAHAYHTMSTSLTPGYHVYGLEWQDDEMRWYLDGKMYGQAYRARNGAPGWFTPGSETGPFDVNFHILLNLAVGGTYTGNVDSTEISRTLQRGKNMMQVDFVRVYGK